MIHDRASSATIGARVLAVEGDLKDAHALTTKLEGEGYEVVVALSGRRAISELQKSSPAIVLLDLDLPDLDGFQVLQRIREKDVSVRRSHVL